MAQLNIGAAWTMLIALSATHVSVIFPFKGESSTAPLIIFLHLYIVFCHMFLVNFLNISQCTQHALG